MLLDHCLSIDRSTIVKLRLVHYAVDVHNYERNICNNYWLAQVHAGLYSVQSVRNVRVNEADAKRLFGPEMALKLALEAFEIFF